VRIVATGYWRGANGHVDQGRDGYNCKLADQKHGKDDFEPWAGTRDAGSGATGAIGGGRASG